jgi:valyl-tRNA synthetase
MDPTGHINTEGGAYAGLDRYAARKKIVQDLEERNLLGAVKDYTNNVGHCDRCKTVVEPRLSTQWFIKIQPLAEKAIAAVKPGPDGKKAIRFTPEQYEKTYLNWMENIHDWCISRQLWWGHRIPAWHCASCHKITVPLPNASPDPTVCAHCGSAQITQETDVLDTWFSAGLLPVSVFGWPNIAGQNLPQSSRASSSCHPERAQRVEGPASCISGARVGDHDSPPRADHADFDAFYPTSLLVTGFDILFFWVARMIMFGCWFAADVPLPDGSPRPLAESVPFREVYIHALVRDANREKMSKTKGNVVDPIEVVKQYGTDAVRFTLASMASPGTDIAFNVARTEGYRAFANKIWNAARFLFMNVDRAAEIGITVDPKSLPLLPMVGNDAPLEDRWIIAEFHSTASKVNNSLENYRYDDAANTIYQFFWGSFCDWYLEIVKLRLDFSETADRDKIKPALTTLLSVFEASLRLLSPFMPFITEEIWHALYDGNPPAKSIALTQYPQARISPFYKQQSPVLDMSDIQRVVTAIRALRKDIGVPERESVPVHIYADPKEGMRAYAFVTNNEDIVCHLARVTEILYEPDPLTTGTIRSEADFDVAIEYETKIDVAAERDRLTKDIAKYEKGMASAERQLGNEGFLAKAPAHLVEGLKKQESETRLLLEKARAALVALPPES